MSYRDGQNVRHDYGCQCEKLESENKQLLSLLAKERDEFGKKECELKSELKSGASLCAKLTNRINDREAEISRYREALRKICVEGWQLEIASAALDGEGK